MQKLYIVKVAKFVEKAIPMQRLIMLFICLGHVLGMGGGEGGWFGSIVQGRDLRRSTYQYSFTVRIHLLP
jgi:hypothetical protein